MFSDQGKSCESDKDGTETGQEYVRAIQVCRKAQFASQVSQPQDSLVRPRVADVIHKESREQNQDKDAANKLQS
jgi:hypothetical protein